MPDEDVVARSVQRDRGEVAGDDEREERDGPRSPERHDGADPRQRGACPAELVRDAVEEVAGDRKEVGRALDPRARPELATQNHVEETMRSSRGSPQSRGGWARARSGR